MSRFLTLVAVAALVPLFAFAQTASLFRSPYCGCCLGHAEYLKNEGYEVEVVEMEQDALTALKQSKNIPAGLQGCHTVMIEGYVVEGHVPVEAIEKLLAERPEITGISLPGMPMGSPGMNGEKTAPFTVMKIGGDGGVFTVI